MRVGSTMAIGKGDSGRRRGETRARHLETPRPEETKTSA